MVQEDESPARTTVVRLKAGDQELDASEVSEDDQKGEAESKRRTGKGDERGLTTGGKASVEVTKAKRRKNGSGRGV